MTLTWLGHACFALEQNGYRIVIDPYTNVEGHADVQTSAHAVYCSHQHYDHSAVSGVTLLPARECPFTVRTVKTCHDEEGGALRGENLIHIFSAGGITIAHLGDLGHQLTPEQLSAIGKVDGILVPIGGTYTVDATGAKQVCDAIGPKWVVPMHYRHAPYGFLVLQTVEDFTALWPEAAVSIPNSFSVDTDTCGVLVPAFP